MNVPRVSYPILVLAALACAAWLALAGEPPAPRDLPGGWPEGQVRASWLAPYVRHVETWIGSGCTSRVTWFEPDGSVRRDVEGVAARAFVSVSDQGRTTIYGTLADWEVALPKPPPGAQSYLHAAGPRVFVRDTWKEEGAVRADVYVDGSHVATLGPYLRYRAEDFHTNEDGSLAVLVRPSPDVPTPQVRAFAPGARPTFVANLDEHALVVAVAPRGAGVLVATNDESARPSRWLWVTEDGALPAPGVGPNPVVLGWVPGTATMLLACSGADPRVTYELVDLTEGRVRWSATDPAEKASFRGPESVVVDDGLVLLAGIECKVVEGVGHWLRSVYALDLATGAPLATWRSSYRGPPGYEDLRFARRAGQLYVVSDEAFASFPPDDLASRTNGWRAGTE